MTFLALVEYKAEDIKFDVARSLGVSGDEDIPTVRKEKTVLTLVTYADWSEDEYDDLAEDIRDKYVLMAMPSEEYIAWREFTDE